MKKLFFTTLITVFAFTATFAQGYKIAYLNVEFVLAKLPQMKSIQKQLQIEGQQLQKQLIAKQRELEQKFAEYERTKNMMSAITKADKERELQDLQLRLQKMQQESEVQLIKREQELTQPLFSKIQTAIDAVAKAKGYYYVLNSQTLSSRESIVLYAKNDADNITIDVLKQLGVTLTAAELAKAKGK
ncbi:MAG: OmpH family outer membrane protein [Cytophagales bacterium]|nr:OmpH family outer membrane protein [Cytophagales bacterium]